MSSPSDGHEREYPVADLEKERLELLQNLEILDSDGDRVFNQVTQLACLMFDCPIALVSLLDEKRQWFLSHTGLPVKETPRELAFCNYPVAAAASGRKKWPFIVWNAEEDERFASNALVTGFPDIRFYAGVPLVMDKDRNLSVGTLCLLDRSPRNPNSFNAADEEKLRGMADVVVDILHAQQQRTMIMRRLQKQTLLHMGHQMLNPLHALRDVTSMIQESNQVKPNLMEMLQNSVDQLTAAIESASSSLDAVNELQLQFTPTLFSPADALRDVVNFFGPLVPAVQLSFINGLDSSTQIHRVKLQRAKFTKCIEHLCSIALRGMAGLPDPTVATSGLSESEEKVSKFDIPKKLKVEVLLSIDKSTDEIVVSVTFNTGAVPHVRLSTQGFSFVDGHLFMASKIAEQLGGKLETPLAQDIVHGGDTELKSPVSRSSIQDHKNMTMSLHLPNSLVSSPSLDPVDFVPAMRRLAEDYSSDIDVSMDDTKCSSSSTSVTSMSELAAEASHAGCKRKRAHDTTVYVVDDESVNRMILTRMLANLGFQKHNIISFADGNQVPINLTCGKKAQPDICFVDIIMHSMNGDELCERMRENGWTCPIIAVTGNVLEEKRLLEIGFDMVIRKPFDSNDICRSLTNVTDIARP
mmetsp:Transcript_433/g.1027  ORF Transcript_433/g.1027 Transcript_433/m.1027 type:complete len:639 (+) Transcript_433:637-2553(+)